MPDIVWEISFIFPGNPEAMLAPPAPINAMPPVMYLKAREIINDGWLSLDIIKPFKKPLRAPHNTASPADSQTGMPAIANRPNSPPDIAPTPATERSRLPEINTIVMAEATMITLDVET